MVEERKRLAAACARMSPEGRAKTAAVNSWKEMVEEKNRLKAACMAFTPEGRAKRAAWPWGEYMHEQLKLRCVSPAVGGSNNQEPPPVSPRALTRVSLPSASPAPPYSPHDPPPARLSPRLSPLTPSR